MKSRDEIAKDVKKKCKVLEFDGDVLMGRDEVMEKTAQYYYEQGAKDALEVAAKEVTEYLRKGR